MHKFSFPKINQSFLTGAMFGLCICLGAMLYVDKAQAQSRALGPYMIMHHSNTTALAGVFRVNQSTGYMSYCYIDANGRPAVTCTPEVP